MTNVLDLERARQHLTEAYQTAVGQPSVVFVTDDALRQPITVVCSSTSNRACVRVLLACALAKVTEANIDVRKPYTRIPGEGTFSGRTYDEQVVGPFALQHRLPVNTSTAFLTPALRNRNAALTPDLQLEGRPREVYVAMLNVLDDIASDRTNPGDVLMEVLRQLIHMRERNRAILAELQTGIDHDTLSAAAIVQLIRRHMDGPNARRLPVLVVAAAFIAGGYALQLQVAPLLAHNAADAQTGTPGDIQITHTDGWSAILYEVKQRVVTLTDIDLAVQEKIAPLATPPQQYVFVTTEPILLETRTYAQSFYGLLGVEMDVMGVQAFLEHFLHFFHPDRMAFLEAYQMLVLEEPDSAVSQSLKELWLVLRRNAESTADSKTKE